MAHFFVLDGIVRAWVDETLDFCRSMTLVITSFVMRKSASAPKSAGFGRVTNLATAAVLQSWLGAITPPFSIAFRGVEGAAAGSSIRASRPCATNISSAIFKLQF